MTQDWLNTGRIKLLFWTCGSFIVAAWALVLVWLISGDLEWETAVASTALSIVLVGIGLLARNGRSRAATWILIGLLMVLIALDSSSFGLSSPGAAAFVMPVVLAACSLGLWSGLGTALAATAVTWLVGWGTTAGWYEPYGLVDISHLTFNAPFYSVIFVVTAVIVGGWTRYLTNLINQEA